MGFRNRLKKVKDSNAPIPERVMALCDALTHCHSGFPDGKKELKEKFDWEIGEPVSEDALMGMAQYLEEQWELNGRGKTANKET